MNWVLAVVTLICAAGTGLCYYFMELSPKSPGKRLAEGREFRMPDVRFRYTPQELHAVYADAGEAGRPLMKRYWLIDFGLIASFLGVMIAIALNVVGRDNPLFWLMGAVAVARAAVDVLEDLLFLSLLRAFPQRRDGTAKVASAVTAAKFILLYAWIGMLFIKVFASAFGIRF